MRASAAFGISQVFLYSDGMWTEGACPHSIPALCSLVEWCLARISCLTLVWHVQAV